MVTAKKNNPGNIRIYIYLLSGILIAAFLLGGCMTTNPATISEQNNIVNYFPVQTDDKGDRALLLFEGELVVEDEYIRAKRLDPGENVLVVWPKGYSLDTSNQLTEILDDKDQVIARVGDNIKMGSGYIRHGFFDVIDLKTGQTLPDESIKAKEPFWSAWDIQFYPFRPFYINDHLEANKFDNTTEGILKLDNRYLRLNTLSGKSYLPVWPYAYEVRKNDGSIYLAERDVQSQWIISGSPELLFIGTEGTPVIVQGAEVTADVLKKYLTYPLPKDWKGPFWVVTEIKELN